MHVAKLRRSLDETAGIARDWFEDTARIITRTDFERRSPVGTAPKCGVYVYFAEDGSALYAGQSKRRIKLRLHDQTSPHSRKRWWDSWSTIRFLPIAEETDRLVLELLLIIAYAPPYNSKPRGIPANSLFVI